ncbi:hypothetical protein E4U42_005970 [Claviceps africana]|uniref:Uncharacterized protein n=1 Tax=Claviceps africana TaxID=83212 RepID=A0A8K0J533_9HYPO|nr:hypothetical protein E4U42_005970 [Claviceps africana]
MPTTRYPQPQQRSNAGPEHGQVAAGQRRSDEGSKAARRSQAQSDAVRRSDSTFDRGRGLE